MKKKFTKEELVKKATEYFKSHPKEREFHATEDGMFFTKGNVSLARLHNKEVVKGEIHTIRRIDMLKQEVLSENKQKAASREGAKNEPSASGDTGAGSQEPGNAGEELDQLQMEQLQDEYERVTGNKPGNRKAETLQKEIEDAKAKQ